MHTFHLENVFAFTMSPVELMVRGTLMFWFLFVLFRFVLHRDTGSVGLADILVVVVIADAAQNGMAGEYKSVSEAFVLISTIAAWNFWVDWMAYHYPAFARFAEPRAVPLIRHGRVLRANLRREMLTDDELESQLRQSGVENAAEVKHAVLEPDGTVSVIRYSAGEGSKPKRSQPGA